MDCLKRLLRIRGEKGLNQLLNGEIWDSEKVIPPRKPARRGTSKEKAPDYSGAKTSWRWTESLAKPYQRSYSREQGN